MSRLCRPNSEPGYTNRLQTGGCSEREVRMAGAQVLRASSTFVKFDKIRSFLAFWGIGGRVPGGVVFRKLSKLLNQEDAWAPPAYAVISALRRCTLAGRRKCCGKAYSFILMSLYSSLHPDHSCGQALMFPGGGGRCTGRARRCKAKRRRRSRRPRRLILPLQ